jgi:acetyltransferase-like isoleucine patch superfamily enzyme
MEKQLKVISSTKAPMNKNTVWLDPKQDSIKFFDNGKWKEASGASGGTGLPEGVSIGKNTKIGANTAIERKDGAINIACDGINSAKLGGWSEIGIYSQLGQYAKIESGVDIGEDTSIGEGVLIPPHFLIDQYDGKLSLRGDNLNVNGCGSYIASEYSDFILYYGWLEGPLQGDKYYGQTLINAELGYIKFESSEGHKSIEITDDGLRISKGESTSIIGKNVTIPDNLSFSIADNILTITDGTNTWKLTSE